MILRLFRVARLADSGRTKVVMARKEPRSITLLHERRKSIDLGTEAAARRLEEKPTVDPIVTTPRARIAEAREPQGIDIF